MVAREKLSVIRSGKVAVLVDIGSPLSGSTERAWLVAGGLLGRARWGTWAVASGASGCAALDDSRSPQEDRSPSTAKESPSVSALGDELENDWDLHQREGVTRSPLDRRWRSPPPGSHRR